MVKTNSFSKKLISLVLAVLMALSCFSGLIQAKADTYSSDVEYNDDSLAYNYLGWVETTDDQTLTALLDWLDSFLASNLSSAKGTLNVYVASLSYDATSIDGLFQTIANANEDILHNTLVEMVLGGNADDINLGGAYKDYEDNGSSASTVKSRENCTSKEILEGIINIIYMNTNDSAKDKNSASDVNDGGTVLNAFVNGTFSLGSTLNGIVSSALGDDLYGYIGGLIGLPDGYEGNIANNIVAYLLDVNVADDLAKDGVISDLDMSGTSYYFKDSSGNQMSFEDWAVNAINYGVLYTLVGVDGEYIFCDSNSDTDGDGITDVTNPNFALDLNDTAYNQLYSAFVPVFEHTLLPLFSTISVDHSFVTEFTNLYYTWAKEQDGFAAPTNDTELAALWSTSAIEAWIAADYENIVDYIGQMTDYTTEEVLYPDVATYDETTGQMTECKITAAETKQLMIDMFTALNEGRSEDEIDATTLFQKALYSPVALALGCNTGVLNLTIKDYYFGNYSAFFDMSTLPSNGSISANLYGFLKELLQPLFPTFTNWATASSTQDASGITTEIVQSALNLVQYVADGTSAAILKDFYADNGTTATLTESNIESAIMDLLKAIIGQIGLAKQIHEDKWDLCNDVDGLLYTALEEYLKYVLPDNDYSCLATIGDDGYIDTSLAQYEYMARDAVAYVMSGQVPIYDKNGDVWDVYTQGGTVNGALVDSSTTAYDMLNYAACYYADDNNVAELLNITNYTVSGTSGTTGYQSAFTRSINVWTNVDNVVNLALPILADLFGVSATDSEDLIINTIVNGIVNIADTNTSTYGHNLQGVSAMVYNIAYALTESSPMKSEKMINVVYDTIADLLNNTIFGARDSSDGWKLIVPTNTGTQPFTDLVQNGTLAGGSVSPSSACTGYDTTDGILGALIARIAENSGSAGLYRGTSVTDTLLPGIAYALYAVNSFVGFIPQLQEHEFKAPSADFSTSSISNYVVNSTALAGTTYLGVTNNAVGLNRAYLDNGSVEQLSRYFVKVKSITCDDSAISISMSSCYSKGTDGTFSSITATSIVDPQETLYFGVSGTSASTGLKTATITYDIVDEDGNAITDNGTVVSSMQNQTTTAYLYLTSEADWFDSLYTRQNQSCTVYDEDGNTSTKTMDMFDESYETNTASSSCNWTLTGLTSYAATKTTAAFGYSSLFNVLYPAQIILDSAHPETFADITMRLRHNFKILIGSTTFQGMYAYDSDLGATNGAIAAVDKDGNIINYDVDKDYYFEETGEWVQGTESQTYNGSTIYYSESRTHVVYTYDDVKDGTSSDGVVTNYVCHFDDDGDAVYATLTFNDTLWSNISWGTEVPGIYLQFNDGDSRTIKIANNKSMYFRWVQSTGEEVPEGNYNISLCFYMNESNTSSGYGSIDVYVRNTSERDELVTSYSELNSFTSAYTSSDFTDTSAYTALQTAMQDSVELESKPVSVNAVVIDNYKFTSTKSTQATTSLVDTTYGDEAYVQVSSANASNVDGNGTAYPTSQTYYTSSYDEFGNSSSGVTYYYADEDCTIPIYSKIAVSVTSSNFASLSSKYVMVNGDGEIVTAYEDGVKAYVKNATAYESQWINTSSAPYYAEIKQTGMESGYYHEINFVYRDADGNKVSSKDVNWVIKLPEQEEVVTPDTISYSYTTDSDGNRDYSGSTITTENRSQYKQQVDANSYAIYNAKQNVSASAAAKVVNNVTKVMDELNDVNFDLTTYRMVDKMASAAEDLITLETETEFNLMTTTDDEFSNATQYSFYLPSQVDASGNVTGDPIAETTYALFYSHLLAGDYASKGLSASAAAGDFVFGSWDAVLDTNGDVVYDYSTTSSGLEIDEAIRLFIFYMGKLIHRGYEDLDLALMNEVLCATGNGYDYTTTAAYNQDTLKTYINNTYSATVATYDDNNEVVSGTSAVTFKDTSLTPKYGTLDSNGVLQNVDASGNQAYTTDSWDWYVRYLAACINTIATATSSSTGYSEGVYSTTADYGERECSDIETNRTYLMKAENTLVPYETEAAAGFNVSASIGAMTAKDGTATKGIEGATVTLTDADGNTVGTPATTDSTGAFTLEAVPTGTYTATITYKYGFDRTFTVVVDGADVESSTMVGIIACNWNGDTKINVSDYNKYYALLNVTSTSEDYDQGFDLTRDGKINVSDYNIYYKFINVTTTTMTYDSVTVQ